MMATYELRTYYASAGRFEELISRYSTTTVGMLPDYGIELLGHWVSEAEPDAFTYLVRHTSEPAEVWRRFVDDPRWVAAVAETEQDGPLLRELRSVVLTPTALSPLK